MGLAHSSSSKKNIKKVMPIAAVWPTFSMMSLITIVIFQSVAFLVGYGLVYCLDTSSPVANSLIFFIVSFVAFLLSVTIIASPLKALMKMLIYKSGEVASATMPRSDKALYRLFGISRMIDVVFHLDDKKEDKHNNSESRSQEDILLRRALDLTSSGVVILDASQSVIYANRAAPVKTNSKGESRLEIYYDPGESLGKWIAQCEKNSIRDQKLWKRVYSATSDDVERRIYDMVSTYEKGVDGSSVVVVLLDKTDSYRPEEEDLNFIAFAAHELRGPITVIRGYLDVINEELANNLTNDQKELMTRLVVSANRLSSYINNILNSAKYDRRHLEVNLREDTVANIYSTISDDMSLRAMTQNRLLEAAFPADLPTVAADRSSISEVMQNLIDNAIKYSSEGGLIKLSARVLGDEVEVSIEDYGIGMPENVVKNLFHKFYRSHRSRETVAGTGIGLYISKAIVDSHGGTISARSVENEGSVFSFTLPIYAKVADKLLQNDGSNVNMISQGGSWINNHSSFRS